MIHARRLTKTFGANRAVDGLTFDVEPGEVVGFLGPNGAGKSTTIRMLTGYTPPTSGSATINGHDLTTASASARASIGYLPESTPLYPEMRVTEYLDYRGRMFGMERVRRRQRMDEVIEACNLQPVRRRTIGRLSKGNRQRVGLAQALLHEPEVLILDEPTSGFDPNQTQQFRSLLAQLRGQHTVLLSTHILSEIQQVADRVLIIRQGKLVADGKPGDLQARLGEHGEARMRVVARIKADAEVVRTALFNWDIDTIENREGWTHLTARPQAESERADAAEAFGLIAASRNWTLGELTTDGLGLESLFTSMTITESAS